MAAFLKDRFFSGAQREELLSYEDRSNLLFLRILTAGVIIIVVNLLQDIFTEGYAIVLIDVSMLIIAFSCYGLAYKKRYTAAKIFFTSFITFAIFFLAAGTHSRNSLSALFISGIACSLLFFGKLKLVYLPFLYSMYLLYKCPACR